MLKRLGSGQHGTVKLARNLDTGEMVAVKIVRRFSRRKRLGKNGDTADMIKKEVAILKQARHAHVVSLIEVIDDEEFGKVYLILEFVARGEIIWSKKTDKDVAIFELNRVKREKVDAINEDYEKAEVDRFNKLAVLRRSQKVQVLEEHGERPFLEVESRTDTNWSLEYGAESEDERAQTTVDYSALDTSSRPMSMYDESSLPGSTHDLLSSVTPETPKPGATFQIDEDPSSVWSGESLPNSPANLAGTMYGPYIGQEQSNENALQSILDKYIQTQSDWTEEEKEFMYVPCLTISQALDAFRDTVLGLEFLHFQGIIHRDIKPANLLWTADHRVKISDFGVSYLGKPIREDDNQDEMPEADVAIIDEAIELAKTVGTPAFYAPELCDPELFTDERKATRPPITGQIDVWALGVTLYCMIFGRVPFHHENMFVLYEKIAREEVFIPRFRLKGVEDTPKTPMNSNKRFDDIVEYEEVDDELRDLFQRLLNKDPSKRITIKEVKRHPWVLRGIANQPAWIDETDPDLQNAGRKIEVSTKDVQEAVVGLTIVDRLKSGFKRWGSALRGRNRRRAESELKGPEAPGSAGSPKSASEIGHDRRSSLRGDEQIFTALRASREPPEHPLAQSVTASPEIKTDENYFDDANTLMMASHSSSYHSKRPSPPERAVSTAESMKTIRPHIPPEIRESSPPTSGLAPTKTVVDSASPSALGGIFGGAGRRFASKIRSRERGRVGESNSNRSSRSSSVSADALALALEDPHSSPSLGFSTAVAAGHVDQPPALREDIPYSTTAPSSRPTLSKHSSSEAFQKAKDLNERRRIEEFSRESRPLGPRHRATSSAANIPCPPSPDDDRFPTMHSIASTFPADETTAFGVSSSSDQLASGISESFSHPSIPSVVSGASSLSGTIEASELKPTSPSTIVPKRVCEPVDYLEDDPAELTPREDDTHLPAEDDEAGYNGEGELDSDSDDGGLEMGGSSKKIKRRSPASATT